ncbi:hypothetical protein PT276_10445 [Orbaceae bacterium ESL0721]|nr:hypothetical protein [Orbaceae bacterium ESL0721]MDF7671556.1 hypothetical protein [Orbaceae bacterium ESL0721]MDF7671605.1 hypothetical protein [Orbaceae bacterium ESL0721]
MSELTNANGDDWHGGLAGQPNNYQRRIGGGLYTEWGYIDTEFYSHVSFHGTVWATNPQGTKHYNVAPWGGEINSHSNESETILEFICVTP